MITGTSNKQIRNVIQLKKKAKEREAQDLFLVEGRKMLEEAPEQSLLNIYLSESFYNACVEQGEPSALQRRLDACRTEIVSDSVFEAMSDTKSPQGVLALVKQFHYREEDLLGPAALCMVLEHLQDPGNLGTILRAGEGAGVTGILMTGDCVDVYNPKVIRSTMGSIYRVPFLYTDELHRTLRDWKQKGVRLFAAHLQGKNSYDRESYQGASAFLIGNESRGLTEETAAMADTWIRIPMLGQVESLNAAVAASLLMYEAARQRRISNHSRVSPHGDSGTSIDSGQLKEEIRS